MINKYLSIAYDPKSHPYGGYPAKLCSYLFQVFNLKKSMKCLAWCGRGEFLSNFQKLGLDVVGVDISPEAHNYKHNFDIKICDVERDALPFKNNTFDVIFSKSL